MTDVRDDIPAIIRGVWYRDLRKLGMAFRPIRRRRPRRKPWHFDYTRTSSGQSHAVTVEYMCHQWPDITAHVRSTLSEDDRG